jgi:hypothetical protein
VRIQLVSSESAVSPVRAASALTRLGLADGAGVHRGDEWPLHPPGEVVVGQHGDLVQNAPLVAGGEPADPDHRGVESSQLGGVQLRYPADQVPADVGKPGPLGQVAAAGLMPLTVRIEVTSAPSAILGTSAETVAYVSPCSQNIRSGGRMASRMAGPPMRLPRLVPGMGV